MSAAVLQGSYAGFRIVKTRRVVCVEVELPIEALRSVLDVLGTPDPATETPVAIARLTLPTATAILNVTNAETFANAYATAAGGNHIVLAPGSYTKPTSAEDESRPSRQVPAEPGGKPGAPRTPWHELTRAQQAGIRCGEKRFSEFLAAMYPATMELANPGQAVRFLCAVPTRAMFDANGPAAARWDNLDSEYRRWSGLEAESR